MHQVAYMGVPKEAEPLRQVALGRQEEEGHRVVAAGQVVVDELTVGVHEVEDVEVVAAVVVQLDLEVLLHELFRATSRQS